MKQTFMKSFTAGAALFLVLAAGGGAQAAVGQQCHEAKMRVMQESLNAAGVGAEQRTRIEQLHQQKSAQLKEMGEQLKVKHQQLHAALQAPQIDQKQIQNIGNELATLKANKTREKINVKAQIASMLSAEQRVKYANEMKGRKAQVKAQCGCPGEEGQGAQGTQGAGTQNIQGREGAPEKAPEKGTGGGATERQPREQPEQPKMPAPERPKQP